MQVAGQVVHESPDHLPGVRRLLQVSGVLARVREIEQQLDAFRAGWRDERGRPPDQLGRRVPVVDRERAATGGP